MDSTVLGAWPQAPIPQAVVVDLSKIFGDLKFPHLERIPITFSNVPYILVPHTILLLMAGLTRTPNTFMLRVALLPLAIAATLSVCFRYYFEQQNMWAANWLLGQ